MTRVWLLWRQNRNKKGDLPIKLVGVYGNKPAAEKERDAIMRDVEKWDYPSATTIAETEVLEAR